jgi:hypothetical protein
MFLDPKTYLHINVTPIRHISAPNRVVMAIMRVSALLVSALARSREKY